MSELTATLPGGRREGLVGKRASDLGPCSHVIKGKPVSQITCSRQAQSLEAISYHK